MTVAQAMLPLHQLQAQDQFALVMRQKEAEAAAEALRQEMANAPNPAGQAAMSEPGTPMLASDLEGAA